MQRDGYRGFTSEELEEYGITVDGPHIVIPVIGRGGVWYDRQRCDAGCHPKYHTPPGQKAHLYNPLGLGPHSPEVWLAEGELDALSLVVVGVPAVGIPGVENFRREWGLLFEGAEIVMALDPDDAGRKAMDQFSERFKEKGIVYSIFDPSPYEDLNHWFSEDREGFAQAVTSW